MTQGKMKTQIDGEVLISFLRFVYLSWVEGMEGAINVSEAGIWPEDAQPVRDFLQHQTERCDGMDEDERREIGDKLLEFLNAAQWRRLD